jgi:hypothetical protein
LHDEATLHGETPIVQVEIRPEEGNAKSAKITQKTPKGEKKISNLDA